jgi:hypothetical protein
LAALKKISFIVVVLLSCFWLGAEFWVHQRVSKDIDVLRYKRIYLEVLNYPTSRTYGIGDTYSGFLLRYFMLPKHKRVGFSRFTHNLELYAAVQCYEEQTCASITTEALWKADIVNFYLLEIGHWENLDKLTEKLNLMPAR